MSADRILVVLFGKSWRTTLAGYVQLAITAAYEQYQKQSDPTKVDPGLILISAGLAVGLRFAKDHNVSNSPAPLPEPQTVSPNPNPKLP